MTERDRESNPGEMCDSGGDCELSAGSAQGGELEPVIIDAFVYLGIGRIDTRRPGLGGKNRKPYA